MVTLSCKQVRLDGENRVCKCLANTVVQLLHGTCINCMCMYLPTCSFVMRMFAVCKYTHAWYSHVHIVHMRDYWRWSLSQALVS